MADKYGAWLFIRWFTHTASVSAGESRNNSIHGNNAAIFPTCTTTGWVGSLASGDTLKGWAGATGAGGFDVDNAAGYDVSDRYDNEVRTLIQYIPDGVEAWLFLQGADDNGVLAGGIDANLRVYLNGISDQALPLASALTQVAGGGGAVTFGDSVSTTTSGTYWLVIRDSRALSEIAGQQGHGGEFNPTGFDWKFRWNDTNDTLEISYDCGAWYVIATGITTLQQALDALAGAYPTEAYDAGLDTNGFIRVWPSAGTPGTITHDPGITEQFEEEGGTFVVRAGRRVDYRKWV